MTGHGAPARQGRGTAPIATRSAPGEAESGGVSYASVDRAYFEKRGLSRYAGIWSLWALGVGAVISGHFSGWNLGFATGGWGGMLAAGIVFAVMYLGLVFCIAEMSPALPHTGAAYSFARTAMRPWGGFITGLRENVEYVIMPAVIVRFTTACVNTIFGLDAAYSPVIWVLFYAVFLCLNVYGLELSFKVTLVVALLSLAILAFFWINAIPNMDFQRWALNTVPSGAELPGRNGPLFPSAFPACWRRCPWLFGCSSPSSNCRWPPRNRLARHATCRKGSFSAC